MFSDICRELQDWESIIINLQAWQDRAEIEQALERMNLYYKTIENLSPQSVTATIKELKPDIIIVANDDAPDSRMFIESANAMNIPSLFVQDGILTRNLNKRKVKLSRVILYFTALPIKFIKFIIGNRYSFRQKTGIVLFQLRYGAKWRKDHTGMFPGTGKSLKMAVFGESTKEMFIAEGVDQERIIVTGSPKFDALFRATLDNGKEKLCERLRIPKEKNIILLVTQYFVEANYWKADQRTDFVNAIAKATASLGDASLIIKIHPPVEQEAEYKNIVKDFEPAPIILSYWSMPELLSACSLVITVSSTAALEALAIKKPVVLVNLYHNDVSFFSGSEAILTTKKDELLPAIQKALFNFKSRKESPDASAEFVYKRAYLQDGRASKRIADLIRTMAVKK